MNKICFSVVVTTLDSYANEYGDIFVSDYIDDLNEAIQIFKDQVKYFTLLDQDVVYAVYLFKDYMFYDDLNESWDVDYSESFQVTKILYNYDVTDYVSPNFRSYNYLKLFNDINDDYDYYHKFHNVKKFYD